VRDKVLVSLSFSSSKLAMFFPFVLPLYYGSILCHVSVVAGSGWRIDKSSSPSISSHHESDRPSFVCILSQFLLVFPFCSSPLLCVFGSILCHVSVLVGSRGGELTNRHLHLYLHITSPTDRRSFAYLANFMNAGSRIGAIELWCPVFGVYILHPKLRCSTIRPRTPRTRKPDSTYDDSVCRPAFPYLVESSKFRGFTHSRVQKSLKAFFAPLHPRHLPPFPMHINYAFTSDNPPDRFENIGFNKRKARGHLPLKRINRRILWDLIIFFASILNLQKVLVILVF
jgi:hypothetical protein